MPKIDKSKMKCNKPKRQKSGGKKFVVKACDKGNGCQQKSVKCEGLPHPGIHRPVVEFLGLLHFFPY